MSLRLAAASAALIAVWFGAMVPFHPNILEGTVAAAVRGDALWRVSHTVMFGVGIATVFAAAGLVALHGDRLGRPGAFVLVATIVSGVATSATGALEATVFPLLATRDPALIDFDGPLFTAPLFRALTGPWLFLPLGFAALGLLAYRDRAHRRAGIALAATGVAFFALGMWFVPILGPLSCVAFAAALAWWAVILWLATPGAAAGPSQ